MVSQKNKKGQGHAAKLEKALAAKSSDLGKVLQPYKEMVQRDLQKDIMKHPELLRAWVARMEEELESEDISALHHLMHVCSCQVYRAFEGEPEVVRESGLVQLIVKCIKQLATTEAEQDLLATVLDMAEVINDDAQLRSDLFLNCVNELIYIGTHIEFARMNRRIALLMIKSAMQGSDVHREALPVEPLAQSLPENDDFFSQSYIVATIIKLLTKEKRKEVTPVLVKCWGDKWTKRLKTMYHKSLGCSESFVFEFNQGLDNAQVVTLKCKEWQLEDTRFTPDSGLGDELLCHCSPTAISFNIPIPDGAQGEVETVDVPIVSIAKLHKNKGDVSIEIKPAKLPLSLQPFSKKPMFCFKLKAEEANAWVEIVGRRTQEMRKRKSRSTRASAAPASGGKRPLEAGKDVSPPPKKSTTPGSDNIIEIQRQSSKKQQSKTKTPRLSIDNRKGGEEPSPFARMQKIETEDAEMGDDLDAVFSQLREQFQQNTIKKQQRGKEGLERTMELVQRLVDDYKEDSAKRDQSLTDSVQQLRGEAEKAEGDFGTCLTREKMLAKDIENLHVEFTGKAKEHRDNVVAFHDELDTILPKIKDQEFSALSKLRDMVDTEFGKLEEQVNKIQSQKTMMTKVMKFMMAQLGGSEE